MKKIFIGFVIIVGFLMTSCTDVDEEAPRQNGVQRDYILDQAQELTLEERDILEEREKEYKKIFNN